MHVVRSLNLAETSPNGDATELQSCAFERCVADSRFDHRSEHVGKRRESKATICPSFKTLTPQLATLYPSSQLRRHQVSFDRFCNRHRHGCFRIIIMSWSYPRPGDQDGHHPMSPSISRNHAHHHRFQGLLCTLKIPLYPAADDQAPVNANIDPSEPKSTYPMRCNSRRKTSSSIQRPKVTSHNRAHSLFHSDPPLPLSRSPFAWP